MQDDNRVLVGLSFMFLAVCLLNMIGLLLAKFLGAAPLVGLRRALGASKAQIFRQHLVEVGVIGLGGGLFGIALAALGLFGVRHVYENYDELTRLDFTMVLTAIGIAVVVGSARRLLSDMARVPGAAGRSLEDTVRGPYGTSSHPERDAP